jgi:hypothetical protein
MGWRAYLHGIAIACVTLLPLPSGAEVSCIAQEDLPLIYSPDEPPVCPDPPISMADPVPSTIGRPPPYMAQSLAGCAGMMDAIATLLPEVLDYSEFVSGDKFFALAKEWRERPSLQVIEEYRQEQREWWFEFLGPEMNTSGSIFVHDRITCMDEAQIRADN